MQSWRGLSLLRLLLAFALFSVLLYDHWRILGNALALRTASRAETALQATTPSAMTPLTNGQVVEMTASTFSIVRTWCTMYQAQWQIFNQMCLNKELSGAFKQAAANGESALFDFRNYSGLQVQGEVGVVPGTNAPVRIVRDPNSPTHAVKYIYGAICTGELNYACKKVLETNVSTEMTDTIAVPTSEEVEKILEHFDKETPLEATARAQVAEQMLASASSDEKGSFPDVQADATETAPSTQPEDQASPTAASPTATGTDTQSSEDEKETENAAKEGDEEKPADGSDSEGADAIEQKAVDAAEGDGSVFDTEGQDSPGAAAQPESSPSADDKEPSGDADETSGDLPTDSQDTPATDSFDTVSSSDSTGPASGNADTSTTDAPAADASAATDGSEKAADDDVDTPTTDAPATDESAATDATDSSDSADAAETPAGDDQETSSTADSQEAANESGEGGEDGNASS